MGFLYKYRQQIELEMIFGTSKFLKICKMS